MYQLWGPYYDQSELVCVLQIQSGCKVGLTTFQPPPPCRHREFEFCADLDSASKVGNPCPSPTTHREFSCLGTFRLSIKSWNPPPPPIPHPAGHRQFGFYVHLDSGSKVGNPLFPPPHQPDIGNLGFKHIWTQHSGFSRMHTYSS